MSEFLNPEKTMKRELVNIEKRLADENSSEILQAKLKVDKQKLLKKLKIYANRTKKQRKIGGITMFLPATVQEKTIQIMPNLKDINNKPFEMVNLEPVIEGMKQTGMTFEDGFKISKHFMPLKDLAASAASVASKLAKDPVYADELKKGFYSAVVHCGGGFGAATLISDGEDIQIRTSECGHDAAISNVTGKEIRLGAVGASTPMVIENYSTEIGVKNPDEIKALRSTGMAQMATQKSVNLQTKEHTKAIMALLKTGVYELGGKGSETTTLKVKDFKKFEKGSNRAIEAFADNIAQYAISRINRGFNAIFVSGPLAMGLDAKIKEEPIQISTKDEQGKAIKTECKNMEEAVWARINARAAEDKTITGYKRISNFKIVCDMAFSVKNNNEAGAAFLSGETKALLRRGEVVTFPIDVLKDLSKYTDPSFARKFFKKPLKNVLETVIKKL